MPETTTVFQAAALMPLHLISESKTNPRKTFDKEKLAELIASVKERGVLQPILVRPNGAPNKYEVVFGARRYRAAMAAGLKEIPAAVRTLSDEEALALQLVENSKREDVHPLEEADGYRRLHEDHKWAVEKIAQGVSRSAAHIYARLKLCALEETGRKAFLAGEIDAAIALLLARIPNPGLQKQAAKAVLQGRYRFEQAQQLIQREYMLVLSQASFSPADAQLLPSAGACGDCPKSTANQRELFADVGKAVLCTDPGCFKQKADLAWRARAAAAEKTGEKVLEKDPAKLFPYGDRLAHDSGYTDLAETNFYDPKQRTYGQLLKGSDVETLIARDQSGKIHKLVRAEEARKLVKGIAPAKSKGEDPEKKAKQAFEINKAIAAAVVGKIVERAQVASSWKPAQWLALLDVLNVFDNAERAPAIVKRRGLEEKGKQGGATLERAAAKMNQGELACLLLEWSITGMASKWGGLAPQLGEVAKAFGVDMKAIRSTVAKERAAKPAKRGVK